MTRSTPKARKLFATNPARSYGFLQRKNYRGYNKLLTSPPSMRLYFTLWEVYLQISIVVVNRCAGLCSEFCLVEAKGDRVYSAVAVQHRG